MPVAPSASVILSLRTSRLAFPSLNPPENDSRICLDTYMQYDVYQKSEWRKEPNENQSHERTRRRPGKGPALLYRGAGLCKEDRLQPGALSLAYCSFARGAGRHGTAVGAEQQPRGQ